MKSKFVFGLVALMVVLALAPNSFAQISISVASSASQNEVATARNAQTGDPLSAGAGLFVTGTLLGPTTVSQTTLLIDYPGNLTASTTIPAGDPVRIEGITGAFAGVTISSINYVTGVIEVTLPAGAVAQGGSFRLLGVRIDANGLTAPATVTIALNNSANGYFIGSPSSAPVILALTAGATAPVIGTRSSGTASVGSGFSVFTNRSVPGGTNGVSFTIAEGFASAWRTGTQNTTQAVTTTAPTVNSTQLRLTFTGLQSGMTLVLTTSTASSLNASLSRTSITSSDNTTVVSFTATDLTAVETLQINGILTAPATSGSAFTVGPVQVTATLAPIAAGLTDTRIPLSASYPNFAQADLGPLTIGNVINPTTVMLVPYAVADLGFDTGIAIANTTADPFGGLATGGATAGSGPVTVSLYGRTATGATPTVVTVTTSATVRPGAGLDASGNLNSGSTWTVLLSELRSAAGQTGSFTGYMFIQVPFLDGHGASFISDFRSFTSASPVLVLPPVTPANSRSNPAGGVETLGN